MDYLMGIDLGSTNLKAIVYDLDGNTVSSGTTPTKKHNPSQQHPEWAVWEPEQIWRGTAAAIREAVAGIKDPTMIKGLAVTGMGMDAVPVDHSGKWLYPFISWHDPRTAPQQQWWIEHIGNDKQFSISGWTTWGFNTALRILWIAEHEPEIHSQTHKWLLIEDFLNYMLCGRQATDYTMASTTLLFDQRKLDWSSEILDLSGIDGDLMCDALPSGTYLGEVSDQAAELTDLVPGTPVILGGHDYLCGSLPVGAFEPGIVLDITGTWEEILTPLKEPILSPDLVDLGLTVEAHVAKDRYAGWGGAVAAEMVEWYRRQCGLKAQLEAEKQGGSDWQYLMEGAAQSPPGANGLMFLPHMCGSGCPVVDPMSMGAYAGMHAGISQDDMLRAIIEGLDYQFRDIVNAMETGLGIKPDRIVAIGGAIRNQFWMQNKADVSGLVIDVPEIDEATPLGAAILAGIGVGLFGDETEAFDRVNRPGRIYEPDSKLHAQYSQWFEIYRQLYSNFKSVNHALFNEFRS